MLAGRRKRHVAEGKMVWFSVGNKMKRKEKEIKEKKRKGGRERKTNNEKGMKGRERKGREGTPWGFAGRDYGMEMKGWSPSLL